MDLPPEVLLNGIRDFCVIYFKDIKHERDAPPHFPLQPLDGRREASAPSQSSPGCGFLRIRWSDLLAAYFFI